MKVFPENAFPVLTILHVKTGDFLELLLKSQSWKTILGASQPPLPPRDWGSHLLMCRKSGGSMTMARGPGAAPLLEHRGFGEWECDKLSQKLVPFPQESQCWLQKEFQGNVGSARHQSLILSYFHGCCPPSLQRALDWIWAGLFPISGFSTGAISCQSIVVL